MVSDNQVSRANRYSQPRGPDKTTLCRLKDRSGFHIVMLHNLLNISGSSAMQPAVAESAERKLHLLFNGEIYNFRDFGCFGSDTESILPTWLVMGKEYAQRVDGEYAILIYDEPGSRLWVLVDPFMTKPLYYGVEATEAAFGVATCASSLRELGLSHVQMCRPNSMLEVNFHSGSVNLSVFDTVVEFGLQQADESYDTWNAAFLQAVGRRARHGCQRPAVFLSSGYDSGAICLALNLLGIEYDSFSILAGEDRALLTSRIGLNKRASCGNAYVHPGLSASEILAIKNEIQESVEPFTYVHEDQPGLVCDLHNDGGAIGSYCLAEWARRENRVVNLSGAGADEIISDYGWDGSKFYYHSEFGGKFPPKLEGFFPWKKFYDDTQRSYLFKEEYTLGRWGIEGRYPFLDRALVQAFLSLSAELKNIAYKAPVQQFLRRHNYPFENTKKRGFSPALAEVRYGRGLKSIIKSVLDTFSL